MDPLARTITVAFDMSKAFDTINIQTLIRKLLQTKIPGTIIKFIANYIKGHTSSQRQFKSGVPQGGALSPTLFNIYTSEITTQSTGSGHRLYRRHHHHIYTYKREFSQEMHTTMHT